MNSVSIETKDASLASSCRYGAYASKLCLVTSHMAEEGCELKRWSGEHARKENLTFRNHKEISSMDKFISDHKTE